MSNKTYIKHKISNVINITKIVTILYFEFESDFKYDGESHDFWEMIYVDKGEMIATVDSTDILLNQGEVLFHKPNEFHKLRANGITAPNVFIITFVCNSKAMNYFKNKHCKLPAKLRNVLEQIITESTYTFQSTSKDGTPSYPLIQLESPAFGGAQLIKNYLEQLLIMIIRNDKQVIFVSSNNTIDNHIVNQIISILNQNVYGTIDIKTICEKVHYSKTYLSTIFKEITGDSIINHYIKLKIAEAKKLIREKRYNFTQISNLLMFNNPHHFSRVFKNITGLSPSEYSKSVKK